MHERTIYGSIASVVSKLQEGDSLRGELTLVISGVERVSEKKKAESELDHKVVSPREVAAMLANEVHMNDSQFKKLLAAALDLPLAKARLLVQEVRSR